MKTNISENRSHATIVTLHLFKQAIEKTFKNNNGEISHICNYCDFASVEDEVSDLMYN